jgi:hypothetical protein
VVGGYVLFAGGVVPAMLDRDAQLVAWRAYHLVRLRDDLEKIRRDPSEVTQNPNVPNPRLERINDDEELDDRNL